MAQLASSRFEIAAAVSAISLTTAVRLKRNFAYYRLQNNELQVIGKDELSDLCRQLSFNSFALLNILDRPELISSPFLISTANRINDNLEELHRKVLCYEAEAVIELIELIDSIRNYWNRYLDPSFYDEALIDYLNREQPEQILAIRKLIRNLPEINTF
ncbi:MAG: hypothetical protein EA360_07850 [Balneolaceae bacterium]|nr:MAG: hypothetical protein EA360_07850 [Balneolaceae bacterium]